MELATDVASGIIVGVDVVNQGSDANQATPMEAQIVERTGSPPGGLPDGWGVRPTRRDHDPDPARDGGLRTTRPPARRPAGAPAMARPDDSPAVVAWRERMETDAAKTIYR